MANLMAASASEGMPEDILEADMSEAETIITENPSLEMDSDLSSADDDGGLFIPESGNKDAEKTERPNSSPEMLPSAPKDLIPPPIGKGLIASSLRKSGLFTKAHHGTVLINTKLWLPSSAPMLDPQPVDSRRSTRALADGKQGNFAPVTAAGKIIPVESCQLATGTISGFDVHNKNARELASKGLPHTFLAPIPAVQYMELLIKTAKTFKPRPSPYAINTTVPSTSPSGDSTLAGSTQKPGGAGELYASLEIDWEDVAKLRKERVLKGATSEAGLRLMIDPNGRTLSLDVPYLLDEAIFKIYRDRVLASKSAPHKQSTSTSTNDNTSIEATQTPAMEVTDKLAKEDIEKDMSTPSDDALDAEAPGTLDAEAPGTLDAEAPGTLDAEARAKKTAYNKRKKENARANKAEKEANRIFDEKTKEHLAAMFDEEVATREAEQQTAAGASSGENFSRNEQAIATVASNFEDFLTAKAAGKSTTAKPLKNLPPVNPFTVSSSPAKGMGLFATHAIPKDFSIYREAPLLVGCNQISLLAGFNFLSRDKQAMLMSLGGRCNCKSGAANLCNESIVQRMLNLLAIETGPEILEDEIEFDDEGYSIAVHDQIAVYQFTSRANHSCEPNAIRIFLPGGGVYLSAVRAIRKGEEITVSYFPTPPSGSVRDRRAALRTEFGFTCGCKSCIGGVYFARQNGANMTFTSWKPERMLYGGQPPEINTPTAKEVEIQRHIRDWFNIVDGIEKDYEILLISELVHVTMAEQTGLKKIKEIVNAQITHWERFLMKQDKFFIGTEAVRWMVKRKKPMLIDLSVEKQQFMLQVIADHLSPEDKEELLELYGWNTKTHPETLKALARMATIEY